MTYRNLVVRWPDGRVERFTSRISDDGIEDWLRDRAVLLAEGKPDRPPDIDSPTIRTWLMHPGEEHHPFFAGRPTLSADPESSIDEPFEAIYAATWHAGPDVTRLYVYAFEAGGYLLQVVAPNGAVWNDRFTAAATEDEVWGRVEQRIMEISTEAPEDPAITTYADLLAFEQETTLAAADIARGFPDPRADPPVS